MGQSKRILDGPERLVQRDRYQQPTGEHIRLVRCWESRHFNSSTGLRHVPDQFSRSENRASSPLSWDRDKQVGLVFHTTTAGAKLSLLEEAVGWRAENSCTIWFNSWYTFNFTMRGNQAWGWTNGLGGSCSVSAAFTGALVSETGFGLYAGGSSALF